MKRRNFLKTIVGCSVIGATSARAASISSPQDKTYEAHGFRALNEQIIGVLDELASVYPNKTIRICKTPITPNTRSVKMHTLTHNPNKSYSIIARIDDTSPAVVWVYDIIDTGLMH